MGYGLRTDGRGMGGVGVFLSGWERERERERDMGRERERDSLLMVWAGWVQKW